MSKSIQIIHRINEPRENSFVGLSVGVSPVDVNSLKLILSHLDQFPVFVVADSIHKYNNFVFEKVSLKTGKAEELALRAGDKYIAKLVNNLNLLGCSEYQIIRWNDLKSWRYQSILNSAYHLFNKRRGFRSLVINCSLKFAKKRNPKKILKEKHLTALNQYVLEELPILGYGFIKNGKRYDHSIHPVVGDLIGFPELVETINYFGKNSDLVERVCCVSDLVVT